MPFSFTDPPQDAVLVPFDESGYVFTYPQGGLFAEFDSPDGSDIVRLLIEFDGQYVPIDIRRTPQADTSAQQAANTFYGGREEPFIQDNVPPFQVTISGIDGWRTRRRFVDGATAPLVLDAAFVQDDDTLYKIHFAASPEEYQALVWVFDNLLRTLELG